MRDFPFATDAIYIQSEECLHKTLPSNFVMQVEGSRRTDLAKQGRAEGRTPPVVVHHHAIRELVSKLRNIFKPECRFHDRELLYALAAKCGYYSCDEEAPAFFEDGSDWRPAADGVDICVAGFEGSGANGREEDSAEKIT